ncbi:MAG: phosphoribosylformylglycinamidine synthase, partial [Clostridium sp.]|nr:phosphoribosylformylglycinamidine synthase [Clostridium sp.]
MSNVRRIYVEKKPDYAVHAKELKSDLKTYLDLDELYDVRVLVRYDIENLSEETYQKALGIVFSEPPVDILFEETFSKAVNDKTFSVEYLPGQFDQRADSAEQCVKLLNEKEEPIIRSATTYVLSGTITDEDLERVKKYCINPVDSRETDEEKPETLVQNFADPADVIIFEGFKDMPEAQLKELYESLNLAMTFKDFLHIQNYFNGEEKRDPSMTEIRVLDTYWSDHCRHTTFLTELKNVAFEDGYFAKPIKDSYEDYKKTHDEIFKGRDDKYVSLMDIALLAMR